MWPRCIRTISIFLFTLTKRQLGQQVRMIIIYPSLSEFFYTGRSKKYVELIFVFLSYVLL